MVLTPILLLLLLLTLTGGGVMPKHGIDRVIQINQRGLTPRNVVTQERKSKLIQRQCQIANKKEKVEHIMDTAVSTNIATVVTTEYADDE
jgi:hypothetical protein